MDSDDCVYHWKYYVVLVRQVIEYVEHSVGDIMTIIGPTSLHKDDVCIIIRATKLYAFAYKHAPLDQY